MRSQRVAQSRIIWITAIMICIAAICMGCAGAEETTLEAWANEEGWISFPLAVQQEELNAAWEEGAQSFGAALGLEGLDGTTLRKMLLQGYQYEAQFDHLNTDGTQVTVTSQDGETVFSHKYSWTETLENAMQGAAVYVFRTEEKGAGAFTYLCMTEPKTREGENGSYVTFNLFYAEKDYQALFSTANGGNVQIPCMMIRGDVDTEGLKAAILDIFASPASITRQ